MKPSLLPPRDLARICKGLGKLDTHRLATKPIGAALVARIAPERSFRSLKEEL